MRVRPWPSISSNHGSGWRSSVTVCGVLEVVVDGDGEGHLVVLRQGDGQVDVHEEVLEDAQRRGDAAEQRRPATRPRR